MNAICYVGIPQKWESPKGVMMRTAFYNGYSTVAAMCAALKVPLYGDALEILTEQSSLLTSLTMEAPDIAQLLLANSYTVNNPDASLWIIDAVTLHRSQFSRHFMYCPECLRNKLITVFQDIRDLPVCPLHATRIITHCPQCHMREHWTKANLFFCKCGSDRRNTKCESGAIFEEERLEIFGPDADIRDLSYMTYVAQTCEKIWTSRKSTEDKNSCLLEDAIRKHAIKMIRAQLVKYPGFTRLMHLSPWRSSHPLLVALSNEIPQEPDTFNEKCKTGLCCADLELTLSQAIYPFNNRKQLSKEGTFISSNFTINRHGKSMPYYHCNTPICHLIRVTNQQLPPLKIEKNTLEEQIDLINISTQYAALLLHCSRRTTLMLTRLGYLKLAPTKSGKGKSVLITRKSIEHFNNTYILIREISQQLNTTPIHIIRALDRLGFENDHDEPAPCFYKKSKISSIIDELIDEVQNPSRHSNKEPLEETPEEPPEEPIDFIWLSTQYAALLLHCSSHTVLELATLGYLKRSISKSGKRTVSLISKSSIETFNNSYILVSEISQQLNTTPIHIIRALDRLGFENGHDELDQHFYEQSNINSIWDELVDEVKNPSCCAPRACRQLITKPLIISPPLQKRPPK